MTEIIISYCRDTIKFIVPEPLPGSPDTMIAYKNVYVINDKLMHSVHELVVHSVCADVMKSYLACKYGSTYTRAAGRSNGPRKKYRTLQQAIVFFYIIDKLDISVASDFYNECLDIINIYTCRLMYDDKTIMYKRATNNKYKKITKGTDHIYELFVEHIDTIANNMPDESITRILVKRTQDDIEKNILVYETSCRICGLCPRKVMYINNDK